jgi:hypothetical protein
MYIWPTTSCLLLLLFRFYVCRQGDLESIRKHLLQRKGALVNLTGDDRALAAAAGHVDDLLTRLPEAAAAGPSGAAWAGVLPRVNEALVVPTQVRRSCCSWFVA